MLHWIKYLSRFQVSKIILLNADGTTSSLCIRTTRTLIHQPYLLGRLSVGCQSCCTLREEIHADITDKRWWHGHQEMGLICDSQ